ncbi:WD domain, G-beta repeat-containing protein [Acanthamoeba castellanii str. Neff]|uniref:WD domain, G-beta repeat-containing protein n=1 Tax=Acanthamoeba castellanii (strain ATCC 30010 / Neff) TaxID=1257118 RepID=L8GW08_ACACF|nr:WD domain, G-beta repeat-containing protein [Acanthamoeba castellanii str. Neff]ELR17414.1 WD domain, G-beta repeat-containing protein [Acanthamoeba castellanii str. Neff]
MQSAAQPSSSSSSATASTSAAPSSSWQERIAGGRITTAPPAFTKDGDFLITCAASVLKVYSVKTGEVVKTLRHKSRVTGFFFNPANALQLYSAAEEGIIRLWDFEDGVLLKSWKIGGEGKINQAVLDATQRVVYLSICKVDPNTSQETHLISTFNLNTCTSRVRYTTSKPLAKLYVSPRGDFFAALQDNCCGFQLFNVNTKDMQSIHHPHKITSFDFHPTEPCVAYGDEAGVIRVNYCLPRVDPMDSDAKPQVQPNKQTRIDRYDWHTSPISALQFSPDGFYLLSGGQEEVLVLWRLNTSGRIFIPRLGAAISSVTLNEQGTVYAVCCADNSVRIIDALTRDMVMKIQGISLDIGSMPIIIDPRNDLVVTSFKHGSLQRYDSVRDRHVDEMEIVANPQIDERGHLPFATVKHVAFGPKGSFMVTTDYRDYTDIDAEIVIKFWLHDGKQYTLNTTAQKAHSAPITGLACHPILPLVASCSRDGKFKLWEQIERPPPPGSKNKDVTRPVWVCRSVGDFKGLSASGLSFSTDGSLLAVAYKSTITLWDPMSNTFHRSLTFTNGVAKSIKHLAFIPSSRYLVSATRHQLFVWDLVRCAIVWSYNVEVHRLAVDMSVNYKANLVFPSPASLVSSFVVTNGQHIFLFNPSSPKPLHVWSAEKRVVRSLAFVATSSLLPEGRVVYMNDKCELVCLEKKLDKKTENKTDQEKVSLSMSKVKGAKKEVTEEKLSAFESAFGKLSVAGATTKEGGEDTGVIIAREDTGSLFNPIAPQLSHLFNGPSHLLPSPAKIYSSFMEGLLKKAHTQVAATADAAAQQPTGAEDNGDSAMQLDAPAEAVDDKKKKEHAAAANGVDDASTSKNQHKRQTKITEKTFYDSMFKFFSSYAARDEETEMPASLLNELTAPVRPPKQATQQKQGKGKAKTQSGSGGDKNGKANPQQKKANSGKTEEATPVTTTATPADATPEAVAATATTPTPTKSPRKKKRASVPAAGGEADAMAVESHTTTGSSGPREEPAQANGTKTTTPRRRRKSSNGSQQQE